MVVAETRFFWFIREKKQEQRGGCSMSSEALDRHGGAVWNSTELAASGVARPVSASAMSWFPETHLPPKRQLTVRAKSEERDRGGRNGRRSVPFRSVLVRRYCHRSSRQVQLIELTGLRS